METLGPSQTTVTMNTYAAGIATGLVSLVGFGLDSGIESIAAVANWRVQSETTLCAGLSNTTPSGVGRPTGVEEVVRDFTKKVEEEFDEIADGNQTAR